MKGLYKGFCRNEQGTETIAINGEKIKGEWVQGFLATECHIIDDTDSFTYYGNGGMDGFAKLVIPETVGQYTGLTDKNGKKIFEGDIVKTDQYWCEIGVVKYGEGTFDSGIYRYTGFYYEDKDGYIDHNALYQPKDNDDIGFIVIGNIHENRELINEN